MSRPVNRRRNRDMEKIMSENIIPEEKLDKRELRGRSIDQFRGPVSSSRMYEDEGASETPESEECQKNLYKIKNRASEITHQGIAGPSGIGQEYGGVQEYTQQGTPSPTSSENEEETTMVKSP